METVDLRATEYMKDPQSQDVDGLRNLGQLQNRLQTTIKKVLPNFQAVAGANLGDEGGRWAGQQQQHRQQQREFEDDDGPWNAPQPQQPRFAPRQPDHPAAPPPYGIGDGDLDPFGGGGNGMFAGPGHPVFGPGGGRVGGLPAVPRGMVPPGARYDPVGPGGMGGRNPNLFPGEPDPDELKPPGYDDQFN